MITMQVPTPYLKKTLTSQISRNNPGNLRFRDFFGMSYSGYWYKGFF